MPADHLDVFQRWVRPCQRVALLSNGFRDPASVLRGRCPELPLPPFPGLHGDASDTLSLIFLQGFQLRVQLLLVPSNRMHQVHRRKHIRSR